MEPSEHGLLLTDENGCILSANPTFCRWIGYACDELLGMRFQQLLSQEARTFQQMYWQPLMEVQGAVLNVKFDLVHRAGFLLPMMSSAITCQYSNAIVYELTLYDPQGQRYEYELLVTRLLAECCLAKNLRFSASCCRRGGPARFRHRWTRRQRSPGICLAWSATTCAPPC